MQVSECMSRDVTLANPQITVEEAAIAMKAGDFGAIPIGENGQLLGMITDRDIVVRSIAEGQDPKSTTVQEVMSKNVASCYEDQDVNEVVELMGQKQIRRMPVLDRKEKLVGILAIGDVVQEDSQATASGQALSQISQPSDSRPHH